MRDFYDEDDFEGSGDSGALFRALAWALGFGLLVAGALVGLIALI